MTIWGALALVMIIGGIANKLGLPLERNLTVDEEVENSGREYNKKVRCSDCCHYSLWSGKCDLNGREISSPDHTKCDQFRRK